MHCIASLHCESIAIISVSVGFAFVFGKVRARLHICKRMDRPPPSASLVRSACQRWTTLYAALAGQTWPHGRMGSGNWQKAPSFSPSHVTLGPAP